PAGGGDLLGDLRPREHAAMARLGTLRELDLDHPDLLEGGVGDEALLVETSFDVATAEIAAADLPDEVAAELVVVSPALAFAGVVAEVREHRAAVELPDRGGLQGDEVLCPDIAFRCRTGLGAGADRVAPLRDGAHRHPEIVRLLPG